MRLFTAIELPEDARQHLVALIRRLRSAGGRGVGLVKPENLHVTLKFIGEVPEERVAEVRSAFQGMPLEHPVGPLFADRAELLPPRGLVRVIAVGLGGDEGGVVRLFRAVEACCTELGFPAEGRAYRPHVTLARMRVVLPASSREHIAAAFAGGLPGPPFGVTHFTLFQSVLKPTGPEYTALARFPLGG